MTEVIVLVWSALPAPGQTNSSFLVCTDGATILIDAGPCVLQQLAAVGRTPGDLTHVLLTHRHGDHSLGYPMIFLWYAAQGMPADTFPTTVAGETTWASLDLLIRHSFGDVAGRLEHLPRKVVPDRTPDRLTLGDGLTLITLPMEHSRFAPVSALRLEVGGLVLAFTGDTAPCDNVQALAKGADLLCHEASYCATLNPELHDGLHGHSTARSAGRAAAAAGAKRLALVHISACYAGRESVLVAEAAAEFTGEVVCPAAGHRFLL